MKIKAFKTQDYQKYRLQPWYIPGPNGEKVPVISDKVFDDYYKKHMNLNPSYPVLYKGTLQVQCNNACFPARLYDFYEGNTVCTYCVLMR